MSTITVVENMTRKYGVRTVPFILLFLCTSTFFAPALCQFHPPPCPVKFDKDSCRPGETVPMYGTVTDGNKPVEGANVVVNIEGFGLNDLEAVTDSNGNWTLSFEVPNDQEFGTWPVEGSVAFREVSMQYILRIQVGEVEAEGDVENEVESLKEQIEELEVANQILQGWIQELEVSGVIVICLAVFAIMYQSSQRRVKQEI